MVKKNASVKYTKLTNKRDWDKDEYSDLQFRKPPTKIPWRAISLALLLFITGTGLITFTALLMTGFIGAGPHQENIWPLFLLGSLMFIPGFYHVCIAYYAYRQVPGYSFDDIPDFD